MKALYTRINSDGSVERPTGRATEDLWRTLKMSQKTQLTIANNYPHRDKVDHSMRVFLNTNATTDAGIINSVIKYLEECKRVDN